MLGLELEDVVPLHLADITFPNTHPLRGQTGQVFAYAIRHRQGVILFETGIGAGNDLIDTHYQVVRRPIEAELARNQHSVDEVRAIVNSHLHFDHCGNNAVFPGVPIYVHSAELQAALQPRYTVPDWVSFPRAEYREINTETTIAKHVKVISTPGHTVGHQSIVVETNAGPVVLAGQAIYSKAEYEHIVTTGNVPPEDPAPEPERYLASAQRLIALRARRVYFSHDAEVWE